MSQPGTWLGKAVDRMCAWLTSAATAHAWDFSTYGADDQHLAPSGDEAVNPDAQHGFSNFVAQHLDLYGGTNTFKRKWAADLQQRRNLQAPANITADVAANPQQDVEVACEVLSAYLNGGGSQKKVLEMILKMLPKLV
jgi:hypothetical protein